MGWGEAEGRSIPRKRKSELWLEFYHWAAHPGHWDTQRDVFKSSWEGTLQGRTFQSQGRQAISAYRILPIPSRHGVSLQ